VCVCFRAFAEFSRRRSVVMGPADDYRNSSTAFARPGSRPAESSVAVSGA
jgi:hypothetical protein